MTITYKFADGSVSVVEVDKEIGELIIEYNRQEESLSRKERYHCISIESAVYEGKDFSNGETPERTLQNKIDAENDKKRIIAAMDKLTDIQRRRLLLLANGFTMRDIARIEKVKVYAVEKSIESARKKFLRIFPKRGVQNGG